MPARPPPPNPDLPAPLVLGRDLLVTQAHSAAAPLIHRAQQIAARLGARWVPRDRGIRTLLRRYGATLAYVVTHERESVEDGAEALFLHPGLYYLKRTDGRDHPLVRAVAPREGVDIRRVVDGTLGMCGDALHLAATLGAQIHGVEASPVLVCLAEEGLARIAAQRRRLAAAARAIEVSCDDTREALRGMAAGSADVVYLDPMFRAPLGSQPGFSLLRRLADPSPVDRALLVEALRVARRRVVLKVRGADPPPVEDPPGPGWNRWIRGGAVDYFVIEIELDAASLPDALPGPAVVR